MKVTLLTVGRARDPFDRAEAHYLKLLERLQPIELDAVKDDAALLRRLEARSGGGGAGPHLVALDLDGRQMDSHVWSRWLEAKRQAARPVTFMIGAAAGLPEAAREAADERLSLGAQTMAHQLARVVLLEQLFRAAKISANQSYHL